MKQTALLTLTSL